MHQTASSNDLSPVSWAMTALVLCAFAGNSLLNRAALASGGIDAASFTAIRIASGAAILSEAIGARLLVAEALVLGGIALALAAARASAGR